uniref:FYVE-type domain-containing protein n=1 Tax=Hyaloperonospora arabidopsidis (strain Emoy2) TaxID=559515 RepID=M4BDA9_HYAAE
MAIFRFTMFGSSTTDRARVPSASLKGSFKRLAVDRSRQESCDRNLENDGYQSSSDLLSSNTLQSSMQSRVRLSNTQLLDLAHEASDKVDFRRLTNRQASLRNWKWKTVANAFTAFSHGDGFESAQEVLATGEMKASLNELAHILSTATDVDHDVMMRSVYKDYIHGSVVHVVGPSVKSVSTSSGVKAEVESKLTVKTSAFERSRMFKNHEQWCFLEYFEKMSSADSFTVTLTSVPKSELLAGKMKADRVDELPDLTAAYLIENISASNLVRVVFFAQASLHEHEPQFDPLNSSHSTNSESQRGSQLAWSKKRQQRLMRLAAGASQLPDVVRRRRFGTQLLADCSAFEAKNSRCTCCAKSLRFLTRKKRCHVCGYIVCHQCWSIHSMETRAGRVSSVRACKRCVEFVHNGDYSCVNQQTRGRIQIVPDSPSHPSSETPGKALTNFLYDALQNSSGDKRKSVMSVVRHLMNQEKEEAESRSECSSPRRLTDNDAKKYANALHDGMLHVEPLPLEECVLATVEGRNYPLNMARDAGTLSKTPMPKDEQLRIAAIERGGFSKITDTDELDLICELLAREMKCSTGLVTLISEDEQHVLASNLLPFRQLHMPREQSFCQHTIMNTEPLLVPHPESDIRFQNLPALLAHEMRFYLGFPLKDENNQVVGSVCCIDGTSRDVSASQYSAMKKLAETASKVVQIKGKQIRMADLKTATA